MAKNSTNLTAAEKKDLEAAGWSEDNPFNVPENVSPVLKSKIIEAYKKDKGLVSPLDMPNAIESGNQAARMRAAADGDKEIQSYLEDADKNATAKEAEAAKAETSGLRRQNETGKN